MLPVGLGSSRHAPHPFIFSAIESKGLLIMMSSPLRFPKIILTLCLLFGAESSRAQEIALDFDGVDDQVTMASLPDNWAGLLSNGFTSTFRLRPGPRGGIERVFFIEQNNDNFATVLLSSGGQVYFYVVQNGTTTSTLSSPVLTAGTWTDVAVRWQPGVDGTTVWINGQENSLGSGGNSSDGTDGVFTLGARTDGAQRLTGTLDEFRIWASALDASTIFNVSNNFCFTSDQLVHDYRFEVGTAGADNTGLTTLPDSVGNNPGTLSGFALTGSTSNWVEAGRGSCVSEIFQDRFEAPTPP
jgi:hypothetical protein